MCRIYRLEADVGQYGSGSILNNGDVLLTEEVSKVCYSVVVVANKLCLCLVTSELLTLDIRQNSGNLTIYQNGSVVEFVM